MNAVSNEYINEDGNDDENVSLSYCNELLSRYQSNVQCQDCKICSHCEYAEVDKRVKNCICEFCFFVNFF